MEDRRKNKRMGLSSRLLIKNLQGEEESVEIEVTDVSKTGIGFVCKSPLSIGTVYEAYLTLWMKESLLAFLEIVRIEKIGENQYSYGAIFIGMSESDASRIAVFEAISNVEESKEK